MLHKSQANNIDNKQNNCILYLRFIYEYNGYISARHYTW